MMEFSNIVGWPVKGSKVEEQYRRFFTVDDDEILNVGTCLHIIPKLIINSGCNVIRFSLERDEDRKTKGIFILTIYDDVKKPTKKQIEDILESFPPIFETIKRDLDIEGLPSIYLKDP